MLAFGPPTDRIGRREWWRRQLQRQMDGNLPVAEFCRRLGVTPVTFYAWKRRLHEAAPLNRLGAGNGHIRQRPAPSAVATPTFVPVSLLGAGPPGQLEVALGNAAVVRATGSVAPELLRIAIRTAGRLTGSGRGGR
jgi:hypothetical protein